MKNDVNDYVNVDGVLSEAICRALSAGFINCRLISNYIHRWAGVCVCIVGVYIQGAPIKYASPISC